MKHIKEFNSFESNESKVYEEEEYDDDFTGAIGSYHLKQLRSFQNRLDKLTTEEELNELTEDAENYERYTDLEDIEGQWDDFIVYLNRKRESMLLKKFDHDEINDLMDELRNIKTKSDLDKLVAKAQMLGMNPDPGFQKELQEFFEILNGNANAIKISK